MLKIIVMGLIGRLFMLPYLYFRGVKLLSKRFQYIFSLFVLVDIGLYLWSAFLIPSMTIGYQSTIYQVSYFLFYVEMYATMMLWFVRFVYWFYHRIKRSGRNDCKNTFYRYIVAMLITIVSILVVTNGIYEVKYPVVKHQKIVLNRFIGAGKPTHHLHAVLASDFHIGRVITYPYIKRYVDTIISQKPQIIFLTGDFIDMEIKYAEDPKIINEMKRIRAPLGVYACLGNHAYKIPSELEYKKQWIRNLGYTLLVDSIIYPQDSMFTLIGRKDWVDSTRMTMDSICRGVNHTVPLLIIEHTPLSLDSLECNKVDLEMCGHTHGGQVFPMQILTRFLYPKLYGLGSDGKSQYYITKGLGTSGPAYRVMARSEVVVLDIYW